MGGAAAGHEAKHVLRVPTSADDKYSRGVVGFRTGSDTYPGAAVLGVEAAWRTGVGMVRYVGPRRAADLILQRRPETVVVDGRVQCWVVGSGTVPSLPGSPEGTRSADEEAAVRGILSGDVPVVVDAGALDLVPGATAAVIVTPHDREHARLRELLGLGAPGSDREAAARETAAALGGVVLLKGSVTIVATPSGSAIRVDDTPAWLATAGTGDVLAGVVGALVAGVVARADRPVGADELAPAGVAAAWLHARAATLAAESLGAVGGPITALDVAAALPRAVAEVLAG